jgi:hypothetical protein
MDGKKVGLSYLNSLSSIFSKSEVDYSISSIQEIRKYFFYLEAIGRVFKEIHNPNRFEKLSIWAKEKEDVLGQIDQWYFLGKAWNDNEAKAFAKEKYQKAMSQFSAWIEHEINNGFPEFSFWKNKLETANWLSEKDALIQVNNMMMNQLQILQNDFLVNHWKLWDIEKGLHEVRRKLRWYSIYCRLLDGFIFLQDSPVLTDWFAHNQIQIQPDVSFNLFAPIESNYISIRKSPFYTLSAVIEALGTAKDKALEIILHPQYVPSTNNLLLNNQIDSSSLILHEIILNKQLLIWLIEDHQRSIS